MSKTIYKPIPIPQRFDIDHNTPRCGVCRSQMFYIGTNMVLVTNKSPKMNYSETHRLYQCISCKTVHEEQSE